METRPLAHLNMQIYNIYLKNETKMCEIVTKKWEILLYAHFLVYVIMWKFFGNIFRKTK